MANIRVVDWPVAMEADMKKWSDTEVSARFSELLVACKMQGPQIVTQQGRQVAALVALKSTERADGASAPTLKALLMQELGRTDTLVPGRRRAGARRTAAH
jgi:prevent-host-death family protein